MNEYRRGITLVETIVVIAIIVLLAAITSPAIQMAREASRRSACQNNLKQIALAVHNFEGSHRQLPSLYNGNFLTRPATIWDEWHFHSWRVPILSFLEQSSLLGQIDLNHAATSLTNQKNLVVQLSVYQCPSAPDIRLEHTAGFNHSTSLQPYNDIGPSARSDYEAAAGLHFISRGDSSVSNYDMTPAIAGAWGIPDYDVIHEIRIRIPAATFSQIKDGLSNTILIGERAGRPKWYVDRKLFEGPGFSTINGPGQNEAAWGVSTKIYLLISSHLTGLNNSNNGSFFSFHPGITYFALADGSVRAISENIDQNILNALITRANADIANLD